MSDLSNAKVGDTIFIKGGHYDKGRLSKIDRITPTGRIIAGKETFRPNGKKFGDSSWHSTWARMATEDDIAGIYRYGLVDKFRNFNWDKLSAEDLKTINEIVIRYPKDNK